MPRILVLAVLAIITIACISAKAASPTPTLSPLAEQANEFCSAALANATERLNHKYFSDAKSAVSAGLGELRRYESLEGVAKS